MSGLIMKYLFKRNLPDLRFGEDPYFEAEDTRRKKFKHTPAGLSPNDTKILKKVRRRAYRLDQTVIGLIPVLGDIIDALLAKHIIDTAKSVDGGLPDALVAQMYANLLVDFGIGLIPFVGDIADMIYKCNTRNLQILEKHLVKKSGQVGALSNEPHTAGVAHGTTDTATNLDHHGQTQQPMQHGSSNMGHPQTSGLR